MLALGETNIALPTRHLPVVGLGMRIAVSQCIYMNVCMYTMFVVSIMDRIIVYYY